MDANPPQPFIEPVHRSAPVAVPLAETERITSIDILRGIALLGILILNIQAFAMPGAAYMNPTAYGDLNGVNYWVWYCTHLLADQKFMTIFSMLFGAGIVVMTRKAEASRGTSAGVHYRRMGWLVCFGLLHAHLLWYGDILYFYGLCGMVVWLCRRWPPAVLLIIGLLTVSVASGISIMGGVAMSFAPEQELAEMNLQINPTAEDIAKEIDAYRGRWLDQMSQRVPSSLFFETLLFGIWGFWRAGGLMLIGMALFKWGFFSARWPRWAYATIGVIGPALALPVIALGVKRNFEHQWFAPYSMFWGAEFNYWGSIPVSLGYASLVMLACKHPTFLSLFRPFAAVGQMAFTNYIMQTLICTTVFYGHGFGLFGAVDRWQQLLIVAGVWAIQLILSPIWLKYFKFGPLEWLWRSLTYWKPQPMRRAAYDAAAIP